MTSRPEFKNDHDALITLITEFREFRRAVDTQFKNLTDNTDQRLKKVEENKAELEDLRKLEVVLFGANNDSGLIKEIETLTGSIKTLWKVIAIYVTLLTPTIGFLAYLIINHILGK